jgi:hypothetical protein
MKEPIGAGLVAGAIAVTAGGGVSIVADGWPEAALVALAVGSAFGLGSWLADRRVAALVAVVRSFCEEAAVYYRAREDGRIDDAEARRIADAADRLFTDIEAAGRELARE